MLELYITEKQFIAENICTFTLTSVDGLALPNAEPGANLPVQVKLPDGQQAFREYSLLARAYNTDTYQIAVLRLDNGRGGSQWMHQLEIGQKIQTKIPVNGFELTPKASEYVLIAGGIGITPLLAMARYLQQEQVPFMLHYSVRSQQAMAFAEEVRAFGSNARIYIDGRPSLRASLPQLLEERKADQHLYVCGPQSLISAVVDMASAKNWPSDSVHYELFQGAISLSGDQPLELVLEQSGFSVSVRADQTILEAMIEAGVEPLYDCCRGECGMCTTAVLEGIPDHRDHYLSEREQEKGDQICLCVSRAKSPKLKIDY